MRVAFAARLDTRLATNATIGIDEEFVLIRNRHIPSERCGFAAAQCGKALPFRKGPNRSSRLRLETEAEPQTGGHALPESRRLSALGGGKAAPK